MSNVVTEECWKWRYEKLERQTKEMLAKKDKKKHGTDNSYHHVCNMDYGDHMLASVSFFSSLIEIL